MRVQENLLTWLESAWIKGSGVDEIFRGDFSEDAEVVT
jgi:hypothetical protein